MVLWGGGGVGFGRCKWLIIIDNRGSYMLVWDGCSG